MARDTRLHGSNNHIGYAMDGWYGHWAKEMDKRRKRRKNARRARRLNRA